MAQPSSIVTQDMLHPFNGTRGSVLLKKVRALQWGAGWLARTHVHSHSTCLVHCMHHRCGQQCVPTCAPSWCGDLSWAPGSTPCFTLQVRVTSPPPMDHVPAALTHAQPLIATADALDSVSPATGAKAFETLSDLLDAMYSDELPNRPRSAVPPEDGGGSGAAVATPGRGRGPTGGQLGRVPKGLTRTMSRDDLVAPVGGVRSFMSAAAAASLAAKRAAPGASSGAARRRRRRSVAQAQAKTEARAMNLLAQAADGTPSSSPARRRRRRGSVVTGAPAPTSS